VPRVAHHPRRHPRHDGVRRDATGDHRAGANDGLRALLNLDKHADLRRVADVAPVQIDQLGMSNFDAVAQAYI
jgi:hypothetical protein